MIKSLVSISSLLILVALSSCAPRGETRALDEIYRQAVEDYTVKLAAASTVPDLTTLQDLKSLLEKLAQPGATASVSDDAATVATLLAGLAPKAGYTSRPALGEIADQFRSLSLEPESAAATRKLLAARTFILLTSELETTQFKVA